MRINKYLAHNGFSSRREADVLIKDGLVTINGNLAELGSDVTEDDVVKVRGKKSLSSLRYLAYYKPAGIATHSPTEDEPDILSTIDIIDEIDNMQPIGRLDKDSEGLIILSNDRTVFDPLMNPACSHEKEYEVTVQEIIPRSLEDDMENRLMIQTPKGDYQTKPCKVSVKNKHTFTIILTEGKNRQIRRMCAALGLTVVKLQRIRIMNIGLHRLTANTYRDLKGRELTDLKKALGV